jgi:hypothetical protein
MSLKQKVRRAAPFLLSVAFGLLSLLWLRPQSGLLYSQDWLTLFIHPFSYGNNPLAAYTYEYAGNPLNFSVQNFFIEALFYPFSAANVPLSVMEDAGVVAVYIVSLFGCTLLLDEVGIGKTSLKSRTVATVVTFSLITFNPFSLTVTWWHFLAWSLFMAYTPYLILTLILIGRCKFHNPKLYLSLALAVVLAPATFGAFSGVVVLCYIVFAIAFVVDGLFRRAVLRRQLARVFAFLAAGLVTLWSSVEYVLDVLLLPSQYRAYYYSLGSPAGSIQSLFVYQSQTTTLWNNFRLVGFLWLAPNRVAASYPWSGYLAVIVAASALLPLLLVLGTRYLRRVPVLFPLFGLDLLFLMMSTGDNPPFGGINTFLLGLGGPFLVETNAYNFTMQIYVLTLALIAGLAANELCDKLIFASSTRSHLPRNELNARSRPGSQSFPLVALATIVIAVSVAATSSVPFVLGNVYTNQGWIADQIELPQDFNELSTFFSQNYSGPEFYAAELPLSSDGPVDIQFGNASFPDSSNLLSKYVPYPLIYGTTTPAATALDNYLVTPSARTMVPILRAEHIKFVIVSPYSNDSAWYMNTAPNGGRVNMSAVTCQLDQAVGPPHMVGTFQVFVIPGVTPIVDLYSVLPTLSASDLGSFLTTVSTFESANASLVNLIESSIWAGENSTSPTIIVQPISQTSSEVIPLPPQTSSFLGSSNGTYYPLQDSGGGSITVISNSSVATSPETLFSPSTGNYTTSLQRVSSGWMNTVGSISYFHPYGSLPVSDSINVNLTLSYSELSQPDWTNIFVTSNSTAGQTLIQYTIYVDDQGAHLENALYVNGTLVDWGHLDFPASSLLVGPVQFAITLNSTSLVGTISGEKLAIAYPMSLDPLIVPPGGGRNTSANLTGFRLAGDFSLNVTFVYPQVDLENVRIVRGLPYDTIMSVPWTLGDLKIEPPTSSDNTGFGFQEHDWKSPDAYLIGFYPGSPYTAVVASGARVADLQEGPDYTVAHLVGLSTVFSVSFEPARAYSPIEEVVIATLLLVALAGTSACASSIGIVTRFRRSRTQVFARVRVVASRVRRLIRR